MRATSKLAETKAAVAALGQGPDRSSLFHWMVQNHPDMEAVTAGKRICWRHVCEVVGRLGLTDINGKAPSTATARKTWYRARIAVGRQLQRQPPAYHPPMRSAVPSQHLQPVARPIPIVPQSAAISISATGETPSEADARADAEIDRMLRRISEVAVGLPIPRS